MKRCEKCGLVLIYPNATNQKEQKECNYCKGFKRRKFYGQQALLDRLGEKETIGVTVSGGKDSLFVWHWLVEHIGADRVIAFNHRKNGAVHSLALDNMNSAAEILRTKFIIIEDYEFYPRFKDNLNSYLNTPNPAVMRAVLCAGCRNGISNRIFEECKIYNIRKVVNGSSYLELAPFKGHHMAEFGMGSEIRGLLKGLMENDEYLSQENLEVIIKDHFNCHDRDLSKKSNQQYVDYIDFYDYFENKPKEAKALVVNKLKWRHPENQTWRFDCIVEDYKQIIYYAAYGYSELDYKYSEMVRYGLLSREDAIAIVKRQNNELINNKEKLEIQMLEFGFDEQLINQFQEICKIAQIRGYSL